jgi:hypothetical protein
MFLILFILIVGLLLTTSAGAAFLIGFWNGFRDAIPTLLIVIGVVIIWWILFVVAVVGAAWSI